MVKSMLGIYFRGERSQVLIYFRVATVSWREIGRLKWRGGELNQSDEWSGVESKGKERSPRRASGFLAWAAEPAGALNYGEQEGRSRCPPVNRRHTEVSFRHGPEVSARHVSQMECLWLYKSTVEGDSVIQTCIVAWRCSTKACI